MKKRVRIGATLGGLSLAIGLALSAAGQARPAAAPTDKFTLRTQTTEEGQTVIYDAYTWQRRELDKRLPIAEAWPSEATIGAAFAKYNLDKPPVPTTIPVPSRIMTDVYLVNSATNHTYLIDGGAAGLIIIDPGFEKNVESILRNVEALGFSRKAIKWVINTHAHIDHAMADAAFQKLGAKILVGRGDVAAVEKGTAVTARFAIPGGMTAAYPTLRVDWPVDDGEQLLLGNKAFYAIATPGHTDGSTCYMLTIDGKNILFGGDTVLFDYRLGAQGSSFADNVAYLASFRKLAGFSLNRVERVRWDVLLPGHGTIVLDRAYLDVLKGLREVQIDVTNGSPVNALPFADDYYRKYMFGRP